LKSNVEVGRELNLYLVNEVVGGGLPLFTPKGTVIKREIERFVVDEETKRGYLHTSTPLMAKSDLYKISGHWQHYQDSMFTLKVRDEMFALRPMTCPFQFVIYKNSPASYRDLPRRYAEIATLFRNEQSGELRGLTRLRQFTLSDAHIICRPDQFEQEFEGVIDLINFCMAKLGISETWYRFSQWDPNNKEKYVDNPAAWESSQKLMKKIITKLKLKCEEGKGEAAFYGPKLDVQYKDVYGKEDTLLTVQIDFALPERFDLTYVDKDGKEKRPMVIHRSSAGCTERTISYILEKTQGKLPLWLNPVQVKIVTITDDHAADAGKIRERLLQENFRAELDDRVESLGKKVRDAQMEKVNYIVTVGDKEVKNKVLAIRNREGKTSFDVPLQEFLEELKKEREEKR
jgi:threonyl-tRNA synthetase